MSSRHPLGDARRILAAIEPISRLFFSLPGLAVFSVLGVLAIMLLIVNGENVTSPVFWLAQMNIVEAGLLTGAVIFGKLIHELGHAAALKFMSRAEGIDVGAIQIGITRFFFFPFPYTDATAAWRIGSRWRRGVIALAGVYFELALAIIAILLWTVIDNDVIEGILLQFAFISAISTLLFNLNPLIKLDGYYLLTDILDFPNMLPRANAAIGNAARKLALTDTTTQSVEWPLVDLWREQFFLPNFHLSWDRCDCIQAIIYISRSHFTCRRERNHP